MHGGEDPAIALLTLGQPLDEGLGWALVDLGFAVLTFETVEDARHAIEEDLVDVVILDTARPAVDWPTAARSVHAFAPSLTVVAAAGAARPAPEGIDSVLVLPADGEDLRATVAALIARAHGQPPNDA